MTTTAFGPETSLGDLVAARPRAAVVLVRYGLDFCCGGGQSLQEACDREGLDPARILAEIEALPAPEEPLRDWREAPVEELIQHILDRYHEAHRRDLPALLAMACKVEEVHADKPSCPRGLADLLAEMHEGMETHMQKEERILFPMILAGAGALAAPPIRVMEAEHEEHGQRLKRLAEITGGFEPPAEACTTWRSLYEGLRTLHREVQEHVHLENHLLFPRVLSQPPGGGPPAGAPTC